MIGIIPMCRLDRGNTGTAERQYSSPLPALAGPSPRPAVPRVAGLAALGLATHAPVRLELGNHFLPRGITMFAIASAMFNLQIPTR